MGSHRRDPSFPGRGARERELLPIRRDSNSSSVKESSTSQQPITTSTSAGIARFERSSSGPSMPTASRAVKPTPSSGQHHRPSSPTNTNRDRDRDREHHLSSVAKQAANKAASLGTSELPETMRSSSSDVVDVVGVEPNVTEASPDPPSPKLKEEPTDQSPLTCAALGAEDKVKRAEKAVIKLTKFIHGDAEASAKVSFRYSFCFSNNFLFRTNIVSCMPFLPN